MTVHIELGGIQLNPNNPLERHTGRPSIQLSPGAGKSNRLLSLWERIEVRVGRYPALKNIPRVRVLLGLQPLTTTACPLRVRGQNHDVAPLAWEIFDHLDSGLTEGQPVLSLSKGRNDGVFSNEQSSLKASGLAAVFILLAAQLLYAGQAHADAWQHAAGFRLSAEYDTNPAMSPVQSEAIWRALVDPSYTLTGRVGENEITTGVAVQIARANDKTLSPDRDSPSVFFNWQRPSETGEFGIGARYVESATRDAGGVEASGRVPVTSTSKTKSLSANWRNELNERSSLTADVAYEGVSYEGGGAFTDYSSRSGGLRFDYSMGEQTTSFIRVSGNKYTPADGGPTSSLAEAILGMNWRAAEYWDWTLQAGKTRVSGGNSDTQGLIEAHYTGQRAQLTLSADRTVSPSGLGGFTKADHVRGGWNYALGEYTNMGVDAQRQRNHSTTIDSATTSNTAAVWADHELAAYWRIRINVQRRTSQGGGVASAAANVIGLSVAYLNPDF